MNLNALVAQLSASHKIPRLLLAPSYEANAFDRYAVDVPFPFYHNGEYWMLHIGYDGIGYQTGISKSTDLLHWEKSQLYLGRGPAGSVCQYNASMTALLRQPGLMDRGDLLQVNGLYWGMVHMYPGAGYESGPGMIAMASSADLQSWQVEHPSLFPLPDLAWEAGGLYKSAFFVHNGQYYIFYNAKNQGDPWVEQIGMMWSKDLHTWHRCPDNPVLRVSPNAWDSQFVADPVVFSYEDGFVMFYYGFDGVRAAEGLAWSMDLIHWEKYPRPILEPGPAGTIDSLYAHKPGILAKDGKIYHFYCAVSPYDGPCEKCRSVGKRGISLAVSD